MTATSEAQPGTRGGGIAPAQTLTGRPKGKGTTKISLTDRIVSTAARWIYEGRRLDMQGLADELGVSRVTLFRRVGSREELISQALWRLTERMLEIAVERWEAERPDGELHTPGTIRHINAMVAGSAGLRRLLDDEPALTMRDPSPRRPFRARCQMVSGTRGIHHAWHVTRTRNRGPRRIRPARDRLGGRAARARCRGVCLLAEALW